MENWTWINLSYLIVLSLLVIVVLALAAANFVSWLLRGYTPVLDVFGNEEVPSRALSPRELEIRDQLSRAFCPHPY